MTDSRPTTTSMASPATVRAASAMQCIKGQKVEAPTGGTVKTPLLDCTSRQPLATYTK